MGSQRVGHDWMTELNWIGVWRKTPNCISFKCFPKVKRRRYSLLSKLLHIIHIFLMHLFIYLAVLSLSHGTQDLHCIMWDLSLHPMDSLVVAHGLSCSKGMWDLSFLTRDPTWVSCVARQILSHCTTGKSLIHIFRSLSSLHFSSLGREDWAVSSGLERAVVSWSPSGCSHLRIPSSAQSFLLRDHLFLNSSQFLFPTSLSSWLWWCFLDQEVWSWFSLLSSHHGMEHQGSICLV